MNKLVLLLGLIILTACSGDFATFDELENNNTEGSGSNYQPLTVAGGYTSPWFNNTIPVQYHLDSGAANQDGVVVRVTPYIGLAYYDGADDGVYNTPTNSFNIAGGAYPNLYANGREYGSYVQGNPIVLANTPNWYTHELFIQSKEDHCPLINIPVTLNTNLYGIGFDIVNNDIIQPAAHIGATLTPPPPAGTLAEEDLLKQYGKVFYYKVEYGPDEFSFAPDDTYYVFALEADPQNDAPGEWDVIPDPSSTSGFLEDTPFGGRLYYHIGGVSGPATNEIVVDKTQVIGIYDPHFVDYVTTFTVSFSSTTRSIYATSSTSGIGMHFQ